MMSHRMMRFRHMTIHLRMVSLLMLMFRTVRREFPQKTADRSTQNLTF